MNCARSLIYPKTLQLEAGNDLVNSLKSLALKENKCGYILSVVGNLSTARFQCPGQSETTIVKSHLEIIALNGTISPEKCHLHISVSDGECNVWAGHLEEGTIILKSADIFVGFINEITNNEELNSKKPIIEIFILPDCPWSSRAVRMLRTLQTPHEIKVVKNDNDFKSLHKRTKYSSFPQIFLNGEFIGGYSELTELHSSGKLSSY